MPGQMGGKKITVQNLEMVPLSELPNRWDENVLYNTPPQNL